MSTVLTRYADLADHFGRIVETLPADAWDWPSSCDGWSGRDVLRHVVRSQRDFLTRQGLQPGADLDADVEARLETDPVAAWRVHDDAMRRLLADQSVVAREYDGMLGRTTIGATIVTFYGFDLAVHGWDLARAAGRDEAMTGAELDLIEAALPGFGGHLYDDGVCKPPVATPEDADRQVRILALLGRRSPVLTPESR